MKLILNKLDLNLNKILIGASAVALILVIFFWFWWGGKDIRITGKGNDSVKAEIGPLSSLSGTSCENANNRPVALMISSDPITRPLSGFSSADMVFEMPVTPGGVTRVMAVFQCSNSGEVGSIRSAREDFIPLAAGLGAVYVHWGGEREALAKLNSHVIDNIDAMKFETKYFYRKPGTRAPHNGFTDLRMISNAVQDLGYNSNNTFSGYPRSNEKSPIYLANVEETIAVNYQPPFDVLWKYDREHNLYKRFRDNKPETDKNNGKQIETNLVIVMEAKSRFSNQDYLTVDTVGSGSAYIYQNGIKISGRWEKSEQLDSKLYFRDLDGKEIEFVPGKIWIEIITN